MPSFFTPKAMPPAPYADGLMHGDEKVPENAGVTTNATKQAQTGHNARHARLARFMPAIHTPSARQVMPGAASCCPD